LNVLVAFSSKEQIRIKVIGLLHHSYI